MELDSLQEPSKPSVKCYICDEKIASKNISLLRGCTRHSKSSFSTKIEQVMGEEFMVIIAEEDSVCGRCSKLLDRFDKLECDLNNVRKKLKRYLNVKYHLDDPIPPEISQLPMQNDANSLDVGDLENQQVKEEFEDTYTELPPVSVFKCKYCQFMTHTRPLLLDHLKCHTKLITYKCSICQMTFSNRPDIESHIRSLHHSVSSRTGSEQGRDSVEPDNIRRIFKCGLCLAKYKTRSELITHFESHQSSVPVNSPSSSFVNEANLVQNTFYENGESPQHQTEQGIFSVLDVVPAEQVANSGDTTTVLATAHDQEYVDVGDVLDELNSARSEDVPVSQGDECGTSDGHADVGNEFTNSDLLEQLQGQFHLVVGTIGDEQDDTAGIVLSQAPHNPSDDSAVAVKSVKKPPVKIRMKPSNGNYSAIPCRKIFVCSVCKLRSPSEPRMKRHIKGHIALSKRTHSCHICGKVLTTKSNMKRHISNHIYDPVGCEICNTQLTDRLHLKHHMEVVHPQTYTCSICSENFGTKQLFKIHVQIHNEVSGFKCDVPECLELFLTEIELKNHQSAKHGIVHEVLSSQMFKCYICHKILTTYHNLKRHLSNHRKNSGVIQCPACNQHLLDNSHLRQHLAEKHPDVYQCGFCTKVFPDKKVCKTHELTHPERLFYKCETCDKVFPNEKRLKKHSQLAHRDPHCQFCGKEIRNPKKLVEHEKRHVRHRDQYPCKVCSRVFQTPSGLRYHTAIHTGKYNLRCSVCGRGFHSKVVLAEHEATHTKEIRHTCDRCGRNFTSNSTYRMHRIWHDNPFPYSCNACGRKFRHTSILAVHKRRVHTGERPYKCPHCPFTFNISSTLNKHLILHTKDYPYVCTVCSRGFTTRTKIAQHMEKAHQDSTMLNEKPKPCEYKMMLRPEEYPDDGTGGGSDGAVNREGDLQEIPAEQVQHINVIRITTGHPLYGMF